MWGHDVAGGGGGGAVVVVVVLDAHEVGHLVRDGVRRRQSVVLDQGARGVLVTQPSQLR